ncbi:cytochrome oxidase putative small subunit CydP [Candidatus Pandoraea novymonadis]|uniref:Uncharacterized protein n=1 Tax=Candidatus Pandoraea novymonadis TaxID=1808959 RepID=A0ABX5FDA8_9BURK|nr:cytochrome oxidase putative small subunit CydP [Candidatus Pandoraea novymonadis]PSB91758.1 hypothetical protein BZL35_00800 [Candidatus Pandoraea novymonadis]
MDVQCPIDRKSSCLATADSADSLMCESPHNPQAHRSFTREILVVLAVKFIFLLIIRHVFFDKPIAKHMSLPSYDVANALLGSVNNSRNSNNINTKEYSTNHAQGNSNDK